MTGDRCPVATRSVPAGNVVTGGSAHDRDRIAATTDEQRVDRLVDELLERVPAEVDATRRRSSAQQFDNGLAWVHFPEGHGGLGRQPEAAEDHQRAGLRRRARPNAGYRNPIGYGMCGPTVAVWGSEEQKQRYLRPLFTGEEIWCQLFSEPGSGSDFAGLSSRGVRDGDEWIVNGQKVWTTLAHLSRWGLLVVRTDPEAVKHAGLTAFVVDMHAPDVEVRPLRQMTGEAEFNEVYFTDTRIPDAERLGKPRRRLARVADHADERAGLDRRLRSRSKGSGIISRRLVKAWQKLPAGAQGRRHARRGDEAVGPGRGAAAHQHPRQPEPQDGRSGP